MEKYQQLKALVNEAEKEFIEFYEKTGTVKAAGVHIEKIMLEVRELAGDIRVEIQTLRETRGE